MLVSDEKKIISEFAQKIETPFFIYFFSKFKLQFQKLQAAFPHFQILYALKANANPEIVKELIRLGSGCDVSSISELNIAIHSGVEPCKISFTGPGKSTSEIEYLINANVGFINIESIEEFNIFKNITRHRKSATKVILRFAWDSAFNQFGIDLEGIESILSDSENLKIAQGLHFFSKTQILDSHKILDHFQKSMDRAIYLSNKFNWNIQYINFGSGFGVPYFQNEKELNIEKVGLDFSNLMKSKPDYQKLSQTQFLCESGRYLVAESGYYVSKILYKKKSNKNVFLIINGGLFHFMAAAGMAQILKRPFPLFSLSQNTELEKVTIAGKSCYSEDIFAREIELPKMECGDHVVIGCAGAYGLSFSPILFNNHPMPLEIVYKE